MSEYVFPYLRSEIDIHGISLGTLMLKSKFLILKIHEKLGNVRTGKRFAQRDFLNSEMFYDKRKS